MHPSACPLHSSGRMNTTFGGRFPGVTANTLLRLKLPATTALPIAFNTDLLSIYCNPSFPGNAHRAHMCVVGIHEFNAHSVMLRLISRTSIRVRATLRPSQACRDSMLFPFRIAASKCRRMEVAAIEHVITLAVSANKIFCGLEIITSSIPDV